MSALHLWELSAQFSSLMQLMESEDLPPETIRDTIESLEGDLEAKMIGTAHVILNLESAAVAIQNAAAKQQARAERLAARATSLRAYLTFHAQAIGLKKKIECEDFVISLRNNPQSVVVDDETKIPIHYFVQPPAPPKRLDKVAVSKDLKAAIDVPGAHLVQNQRIDISL